MEGTITVTYIIICDNDINLEIPVKELLANEKILNLIKREFTKGARGIIAECSGAEGFITLGKEKTRYTMTIDKNDFADALSLAEDDARARKLFKGACNRVELIDLETH